MERYICIHGHFYQPPRENARLESVERQESAYPYHDWNERVTAECYLPNASSRILGKDGFIEKIVNNYASISFDFGPTLLDWLEKMDADVYQRIIEADKQSRQRFSGHGSAMAQAYNHIIMPLANHRDRYSQVVWGIRDFEHRFGRQPEGMWLPETAVDLETLDIMAKLDIRFTVLAPRQAWRVRQVGSANWKDVRNARIDPARAYVVNLPSKRRISVFFYDGPISRAVAFDDILKSGETFARRLTGAFSEKRHHPQLVHIATDGETYGHHHRFADMALAFTLEYIENHTLAKLTNYGEFLEKYPPTHEVEIIEKSSWSCEHGVDRWWSPCGCTTGTGSHPDWNQAWRTPLRNAFDYLRDSLAGKYEDEASKFFEDPWATRDSYIDVVLDRSPQSVKNYFNRYAVRELNETERIKALKLLEMQRHAMLMYTSCGWFFDELSRPEPVQVMQYAGQVIQLAEDLFGKGVEEEFLKILEQAKSNIPEQGDGRRIYESLIRPAISGTEASESYDARHKALEDILESAMSGIEKSFRPLFERLYPPERFSAELGGPVPPAFLATEELIINSEFHRVVKSFPVDEATVRSLLGAAERWQVKLDTEGIGYDFKLNLEKMIAALAANPTDIKNLENILAAVSLARSLPFPVDLWKVQNVYWDMLLMKYSDFKLKAAQGDQQAQAWVEAFKALGEHLSIRAE
jgi:alpha-amylase/alpha-mannosidase (GH57 family)